MEAAAGFAAGFGMSVSLSAPFQGGVEKRRRMFARRPGRSRKRPGERREAEYARPWLVSIGRAGRESERFCLVLRDREGGRTGEFQVSWNALRGAPDILLKKKRKAEWIKKD